MQADQVWTICEFGIRDILTWDLRYCNSFWNVAKWIRCFEKFREQWGSRMSRNSTDVTAQVGFFFHFAVKISFGSSRYVPFLKSFGRQINSRMVCYRSGADVCVHAEDKFSLNRRGDAACEMTKARQRWRRISTKKSGCPAERTKRTWTVASLRGWEKVIGDEKGEGIYCDGTLSERKTGGYSVEKEGRPRCARARTCGREHRRGMSGGVARYGLARLGSSRLCSAWHGVAEPDRVKNRVRSARVERRATC